jgi:hypothetical protein
LSASGSITRWNSSADLGRGQFRTVRLDHLFADEAGLAGVGAAHGFHRSRAAFRRRREGGRTDGDHLLGVRRLDGLQRVAGIDRAREGVGRDDLDDVRDRGDVQLGGDAGGEVLAAGGGWNQDRVVAARERQDGVGLGLGDPVTQGVALGQQDLADAGDLGGGVGHGLGALAQDQHVDVARDLQGGGDGLVSAVAQVRVVVIGDDENSHYSTPAVLSFETRSAAVSTLMPAERLAGSVTLTTFRRGAMSTP